MQLKGSTLVWTLIWSWFMGITAISIGFGAVFPSMNRIAKPFVCPSGSMELETQTYHPYPGNTTTTLTWYCVDASDERKELGIFPMSLYAGTIYGLLLFGLIVLGMWINARRAGTTAVNTDFKGFSSKPTFSDDTVSRMSELKRLRAANLISEQEYEEKRNEILKSL